MRTSSTKFPSNSIIALECEIFVIAKSNWLNCFFSFSIKFKLDEKTTQLSGPNHNILVFKFEFDFNGDGRFKPSTLIFEILKSEFLNLTI